MAEHRISERGDIPIALNQAQEGDTLVFSHGVHVSLAGFAADRMCPNTKLTFRLDLTEGVGLTGEALQELNRVAPNVEFKMNVSGEGTVGFVL